MKLESQTVTLLVLEKGAEWPTWEGSLRIRADHLIVEAQLDNESQQQFQERILSRVEKIAERRERVLAVGYVCALLGQEAEPVREKLGQALLEILDTESEGELILAGGSWSAEGKEGEERTLLLKLWSHLSELTPGQLVSVRFEEEMKSSGVYPRTRTSVPPDVVSVAAGSSAEERRSRFGG